MVRHRCRRRRRRHQMHQRQRAPPNPRRKACVCVLQTTQINSRQTNHRDRPGEENKPIPTFAGTLNLVLFKSDLLKSSGMSGRQSPLIWRRIATQTNEWIDAIIITAVMVRFETSAKTRTTTTRHDHYTVPLNRGGGGGRGDCHLPEWIMLRRVMSLPSPRMNPRASRSPLTLP